ncbi:hypothetical protein LZZ90_00570 [Flavobacterium sp. SM15]|uniref:hypothetical protein n=1 Tax=Flavobacterium sp. SM15 TaxID=2908005 RepID=UPI001EDA918A|nr:hypothetical protein [Flavobacterium sp. SM15]MCG2609995.1 hypothetical protein [Flavobacterium sp. SM15]
MKQQEIITVFTTIPEDVKKKHTVITTYPELDKFFEKGMYVENIVQSCLADGRCAITFVLRHYS